MCNINAYTEAIKVFLAREPGEMAGNAGAGFDAAANTLLLDYCNRTYTVNCEDGAITCPGNAGCLLTKNKKH
ncbi:MAG: hypothetical protein ACOY4Q_11160 [Bacillota bacterium]